MIVFIAAQNGKGVNNVEKKAVKEEDEGDEDSGSSEESDSESDDDDSEEDEDTHQTDAAKKREKALQRIQVFN